LEPEVVFLFPSIHYQGSPELSAGLYEALGSPSLVVIGNTGQGFYERNGCGDIGVAALGLNTRGRVRWHLRHATGLHAEPYETTRRCIESFGPAADGARLFFFGSDFRTDTSEVVRALSDHLPAPAVGGSAGDDYRMQRCFQYANQEVLEDSIVMLACEGPLAFDIRVSHELKRVGSVGTVTRAQGTVIETVDDLPAMEFLTRQLGRPYFEMDMGVICLEVVREDAESDVRLRSLMPYLERGSGNLRLYGGIEVGSRIQCCIASAHGLVEEVIRLSEDLADLSFEPRAALVVSCAGRKQLLGGSIEHEVAAVRQALSQPSGGQPVGIAGYPSFGEFAPLRCAGGYTRNLFHNMTYALLLLGEA
jgi:hypothetical protein